MKCNFSKAISNLTINIIIINDPQQHKQNACVQSAINTYPSTQKNNLRSNLLEKILQNYNSKIFSQKKKKKKKVGDSRTTILDSIYRES